MQLMENILVYDSKTTPHFSQMWDLLTFVLKKVMTIFLREKIQKNQPFQEHFAHSWAKKFS